jgi:hypothetical protein
MKIGKLILPKLNYKIYKSIKKEGSRIEYSIEINNELISIGKKISFLPLKYASIVLALKTGTQDQTFHKDLESGERAIIYLTDVLKDSNGPIEFQDGGKVLGPAGTYVHYSANDTHRGCKSDIHRYALALAFDEDPLVHIKTIGMAPLNETNNSEIGFKTFKWYTWVILTISLLLLYGLVRLGNQLKNQINKI